jgi:poly(3-hydroxybutyrate) depolymerase
MIRPALSAAACLLALSASGFAQTTQTLSMQVGGKTRSTVIHAPAGISNPPVVFFIHGANGSGAAFESETKGNTTADREKFIAVYPSASSNGSGGTWDDMSGTTNFPFFFAILDTLDARYKIDRNRIYMTGFSQGGMISYAAACFYSDKFAAVAPVSGHSNSTCALKRPVPLFMTFGTNDIGPTSSFVADLTLWNKWNKCPSTATVTHPYPASNPNSGVTRAAYGPCDQGSSVMLDSIQGEGHQWPAANRLNQADEVWAFFKQYSLSGTTAARPAAAAARGPIQAAFAGGMVRLGGVAEGARVRVTDTQGRLVASATVRQGRFDFRNRPRGLYLIEAGDAVPSKFIVP